MYGIGRHSRDAEHSEGSGTRYGPDQFGGGWPTGHSGKQNGMPDSQKACEARGEDRHGGRVPDAYARRRP